MSVQPGPIEKRYAANGVAVSYTVPFLVIEAGDLQVLLNGVQITTGFVHVGIGLPTSSLVFSIPPSGDLYLKLSVPFQRLVDYQENGDFLASTVNRDFDRIWQALKQLLLTSSRSPVLGVNDIDGLGFYRAKGNGLTGLASANYVPDAATNWMDVRDYVASILATGQGPINNAANVVYLYPDNTARVLQTLSNYTNPLLGSQGIGHYNPNGTKQTVGEVLDGHTSTITANFTANVAAINDTFNAIPIINAAQPLMSRSCNVLNLGHGLNIIGDSISAGAYQGNVYTQGWPALLAKAINNQFGAKNLGAIPTDALFNPVPAYLTDQLHTVTWFGDWGARVGSTGIYNWPIGNTGAAAGDAINGKTVTSTNNTAYMEITVPSINRIVTIYYVGQPGGGKFDVSVNGTIVSVLDTAITPKTYNLQYTLIADDGGQGETVIRLTKKDALPTELQPVVRYQKVVGNPNEHYSLMNVCNHSISGRQLAMMTEAGIIAATNCAGMVLALGYNDAQAETDNTYYANFLTRVNWIIQYANIFKCLVVVADFCWYAQVSTWQFEKNVEGWTAANATLAVANGNLRVTATAIDPFILSPAVGIDGATFTKVKVRLTRRSGNPLAGWDGKVFYSTSGHSFSGSFIKVIPNPNIAVGATMTLEWDMAALTAGGTDWVTNTITQIRIDLDQAAGGSFDIDWIAVEDSNGNRYAPPLGRRRAALKRIAKETNGIYIPFPDKFYPDSAQVVDTTPSASELISPLNLFADNAHPNFKGNEMIFTQVARALGLSITSKRSALLSDLPFPLKLAGTLKNKAGDVSSVSRIPGGLLYSVGITANGGGTIASGSTSLYTLPAKFYPSAEVRASSCVLALTTAGVINNYVATLVDGSATGVVVNASVIEGSFSVAEKSL